MRGDVSRAPISIRIAGAPAGTTAEQSYTHAFAGSAFAQTKSDTTRQPFQTRVIVQSLGNGFQMQLM